jgi:hypothetical protein
MARAKISLGASDRRCSLEGRRPGSRKKSINKEEGLVFRRAVLTWTPSALIYFPSIRGHPLLAGLPSTKLACVSRVVVRRAPCWFSIDAGT